MVSETTIRMLLKVPCLDTELGGVDARRTYRPGAKYQATLRERCAVSPHTARTQIPDNGTEGRGRMAA